MIVVSFANANGAKSMRQGKKRLEGNFRLALEKN
jgi:hypothetical protein